MNHPPHQYGSLTLIMTGVTAVLGLAGQGMGARSGRKGMEAQADAAESSAFFTAMGNKAQATINSAYAPVWIMGGVFGVAALSLGIMALRKK